MTGIVIAWTLIVSNAAAAMLFMVWFVSSIGVVGMVYETLLSFGLCVLTGGNSVVYFIALQQPEMTKDDPEAVWGME